MNNFIILSLSRMYILPSTLADKHVLPGITVTVITKQLALNMHLNCN